MDNRLLERNKLEQDTAQCDKEPARRGFIINETQPNSMSSSLAYCTPVLREQEAENNHTGKSALSCLSKDSGFSDRSFTSAWSSSERETPGSAFSYSSTSTASKSEAGNNRPSNLPYNDFSPVGRHSSSYIRQRRLRFKSCETPPPPFPPLEDDTVDDNVATQFSLTSKKNVYSDSNWKIIENVIDSENSQSPLHQPDSLESSLQEMSLEESSTGSSEHSPVQLRLESSKFVFPIKRKCDNTDLSSSSSQSSSFDEPDGHFIVKDEETSSEPGFSESKKKEFSNDVAIHPDRLQETFKIDLPPSSVTNLLSNASQASVWISKKHQSNQEQQEFLSGLSLTPAQVQQPHVPKQSHVTEYNKFNDIGHKQFSHENHQQVWPPYPVETYLPIVEHSEARVPPLPHQYNLHGDLHETLNGCGAIPSSGSQDIPPVRSASSDQLDLKSPVKRCHNSDMDKDSLSLISPTKARKKLVPNSNRNRTPKKEAAVCRSPNKSVARKILHDGKDCDQSYCRNRNSPLPLNTNQVNPVKNTDTPLVSTAGDIAEETADEGFDNLVLPENMLYSESDLMFAKIHHVVNTYSPSQPSQLIGRNIGVQNVDIVFTLGQKNLFLCLEKIFQYLDAPDLISVHQVSLDWRSALCHTPKAYGRYRQHMKELLLSRFQHGNGKENCGEKPVDDYMIPPLTTSRGHLNTVQSQATKPQKIEQPSTSAQGKFPILSDDNLRPCPHCQGPAVNKLHQERATCLDANCAYDFCLHCFEAFHYLKPCKPLHKNSSNAEVAGTRKSRKNLRRL